MSNLQLLPLCLLGACVSHSLDRALESPAGDSSPAFTAYSPKAQETDYSVDGLFHEHHGDFVQDSNPWREDLRLSFHLEDNTSIKHESGSYDLYQLEFVGDYELVVDPDVVVTFGGTVGTRRYDFSSSFAGADGDENLNQISIRAGAGFFVNDELYLSGELEPGIFSDLDGSLNSQDYQFFAKTLATYRFSDEIYFKGGLYVDQVFDDLPVYPVAGIAWLFHSQWRFDALLPRSITLSFNPSPSLILTAGFDLDGNQYNLRSRSGGTRKEVTITTQEMNVFALANYRLDEHFSIFGKIGSILFGDIEFKGVTGRSDGTLEPSAFFELGAGITF